ncbi:MAG TPA: hypothetical protein PKZ39_03425 [Clostridia bacterium]|jgi:hypothetical protein|nr:hypothetical protein [Clostridia bacterium]HPA60415.1 hypothetical protein [Clostridia bacterium]
MDTFARIMRLLWRRGERFRIMAPLAAHIAALEKHRRADAGSVMKRKMLNIRNDSRHFHYPISQ